ncbi:MAG: GxxExxY protein [Luteolibacter sp.]
MNADGRDGIHASETERIIGCAFAVINSMGHGFPLFYREVKVGEYIPDLIVFGKIVLDKKTIQRITDHEVGKMLNYLRATNLPVGLILNFKHAKPEFRRVVNSSPSPISLH